MRVLITEKGTATVGLRGLVLTFTAVQQDTLLEFAVPLIKKNPALTLNVFTQELNARFGTQTQPNYLGDRLHTILAGRFADTERFEPMPVRNWDVLKRNVLKLAASSPVGGTSSPIIGRTARGSVTWYKSEQVASSPISEELARGPKDERVNLAKLVLREGTTVVLSASFSVGRSAGTCRGRQI